MGQTPHSASRDLHTSLGLAWPYLFSAIDYPFLISIFRAEPKIHESFKNISDKEQTSNLKTALPNYFRSLYGSKTNYKLPHLSLYALFFLM